MRIAAIAAGVLAAAASDPGEPIPDPDTCSSAQVDGVDAVEIGDADESSFAPLSDGDPVDFTTGAQGGEMLPIRIRVSGPAVPECIAQTTELRYGGAVIATEQSPLHTYEDEAGARATNTLFVILSGAPPPPGESFDVTTTVGTVSATRTLDRAQR